MIRLECPIDRETSGMGIGIMASRIGIVDAPYDVQRDYAREASLGGRYAAIVEIIRYSGSRMTTVAVSRNTPLKTYSTRGGEFRGIVAQFHDGLPYIKPTDDEYANRIFRSIERKWDSAMHCVSM